MQTSGLTGTATGFENAVAAIAPYERYLFWAVVVLFSVFAAAVVHERAYISYIETDFINFTIPDAVRLLGGEPMRSLYHPPLHVLAVAGAWLLVGDWLAAGLMVSLVSAIVALVTCHALFRALAGTLAGWGAMLALLGSAVFTGEAFRAGNDMLFLALFLLTCWLAVLGLERRSAPAWLGCGLVMGLALLTRSNALPLLLFAAAPALIAGAARAEKLRAAAQVLAGLAVPLLAIAAFAAATGSQVVPANNLLNLTVTYFAEGADRASFDAALEASELGDDLALVVTSDLMRVVRIYVLDFYTFIVSGLSELTEPAILFLAVPGIFILFAERFRLPLILVGLVIAAEIGLTNFKSFDARYYLFVLPLLGAAMARTVQWVAFGQLPLRARTVFSLLVMALLAGSVASAAARSASYALKKDDEIATLIATVRPLMAPFSAVIARKPHIAYYTGSDWVFLPNLKSTDELKDYLAAPSGKVFEGLSSVVQMTTTAQTRYLYFGENERRYRPQFWGLKWSDQAPDWLEVVSSAEQTGEGTLYLFRGDGKTRTAPQMSRRLPPRAGR